MQISEQLLEQSQQEVTELASAQAATGAVPPDAVVWPGAIRCAGLAGAVTAALVLVSYVLPPVLLLCWLWAICAPIVVVGLYSARFRQTRILPGFAARLGLLCGLTMLLAIIGLDTVHLCLQRFVFHNAGALDAMVASVFAQEAVMMKDQLGNDAAPALHMLTVPEFRAGLILGGFGVFAGGYLAFSSVAGAFAGFLRSRSR